MAPAAYSAGTESAAGEALHRLPASEQRPWTWVEPIRSSASTTPGQALFMPACASTTAPGVAAPTTKPPPSSRIADDPGDLLGVDDQFRLQPAGAHLHQKVGPTGQNLREAGRTGKKFDRVVHRRGRGVSETWHRSSQYLLCRHADPEADRLRDGFTRHVRRSGRSGRGGGRREWRRRGFRPGPRPGALPHWIPTKGSGPWNHSFWCGNKRGRHGRLKHHRRPLLFPHHMDRFQRASPFDGGPGGNASWRVRGQSPRASPRPASARLDTHARGA